MKFEPGRAAHGRHLRDGDAQKYQECVRGANPHARGNRNAGSCQPTGTPIEFPPRWDLSPEF